MFELGLLWTPRRSLATQNWRRDVSLEVEWFRSLQQRRRYKDHTLATSSPTFTNTPSFCIRASNDVIRSRWFVWVLEIFVTASETSVARGRASPCADVWACSTASPATIDADSCVTRIERRPALGFPFLSTKDKTTSKSSRYQWYYHQ